MIDVVGGCWFVDMNECSTNNGLGPCGTNQSAASCTNNVGSYTCTCNAGYDVSNGTCQGISSVISSVSATVSQLHLSVVETERIQRTV